MKQQTEQAPKDFKYWMDLAEQDPEQFEVQRAEVINELIASLPAERQMHLRRLQWRVDQVRMRSATPLAATIAISRMMWDTFYHLRDRYQEAFREHNPGIAHQPAPSAQVLAFPQGQLAEA